MNVWEALEWRKDVENSEMNRRAKNTEMERNVCDVTEGRCSHGRIGYWSLLADWSQFEQPAECGAARELAADAARIHVAADQAGTTRHRRQRHRSVGECRPLFPPPKWTPSFAKRNSNERWPLSNWNMSTFGSSKKNCIKKKSTQFYGFFPVLSEFLSSIVLFCIYLDDKTKIFKRLTHVAELQYCHFRFLF